MPLAMESKIIGAFRDINLMAQDQIFASHVPLLQESHLVHDVGSFGYTCLFLGLLCMIVSTLFFLSQGLGKDVGYRKIELLTALVTGIAGVFYMIMFTGSGKIYEESFQGDTIGSMKPLFWARYIDWLLTTPLMLMDILTIAGASKDDIMCTMGIDLLMIAFGFIGSFITTSSAKWIFFILAMISFGHIVMTLLQFMKSNKYGAEAQQLYAKVTYLTIVLWTCYPFVWIMSEGSRIFPTQLEICAYMLLDVSSKCVFGYIIVVERNALMAIHAAEAGYNQIEPVESDTAG